jgi:hypothetical protein
LYISTIPFQQYNTFPKQSYKSKVITNILKGHFLSLMKFLEHFQHLGKNVFFGFQNFGKSYFMGLEKIIYGGWKKRISGVKKNVFWGFGKHCFGGWKKKVFWGFGKHYFEGWKKKYLRGLEKYILGD